MKMRRFQNRILCSPFFSGELFPRSFTELWTPIITVRYLDFLCTRDQLTDLSSADHYSEIATVEANWDLHTLGRYDVGANVFSLVAEKTGDKVRKLADLSSTYLNQSYAGIFNTDPDMYAPQPVPNTRLVVNGRTVSPIVKATWESHQSETIYTGSLEVPSFSPPTN